MTFGLADVVTSLILIRVCNEKDSSKERDIVKSLAFKFLEVPLFSGVQLQSSNYDVTVIYHMVGKMIQGTVSMPTNVAMKEMKESSLVDGEEGTKKDATKVVVDALRCWKGWLKESLLQAKFDSSLNSRGEDVGSDVEIFTSYLATIPTQETRECLQVKPGVVHLANSGHVFSMASGNISQVFP